MTNSFNSDAPPAPASPASPTSPPRAKANADGSREGNGFRVSWDGPRKPLVVQDLINGVWTEFGTYTVRETAKRPGFAAVSGKLPAIAGDALIGPVAAAALAGYGDTQAVPVEALIEAVLGGGDETPPTAWLIPTVKTVKDLICPHYYHKPPSVAEINEAARKMLMATTVLALCGGRADEHHLVEKFAERGVAVADALEMLDLACRKGNVKRSGARSAPLYESRRLDRPPAPAPTPPAPGAQEGAGRQDLRSSARSPIKRLTVEELFGDKD